MTRSRGPLRLDNPWVRIGWFSTAGLITAGTILGFGVLGRGQQNGPPLNLWAGICRSLGITADTGPAAEPQPPLRTPTRIAWTRATLAKVAGGDVERGAFVAMNCTACHGEQGVSRSGLYPTLAGMEAAVIYKQLDDFRAGKRAWGAMNGIGQALSEQASADVAAYFARPTPREATSDEWPVTGELDTRHSSGLAPITAENFRAGRSLREAAPGPRLVFAGDPGRGIPPCCSCHGPGSNKPGAPPLQGQQPDYIERQLGAFAQGFRQNDINRQMRTIATQLRPEETRAIAEFYAKVTK